MCQFWQTLLQTLAQDPSDHWQSGLFVDATLGGGGHSQLLLDRYPALHLVGLDQDATASRSGPASEPHADRVTIVATNFADYAPPKPVALLLADLGVSSPQLDVAERGFASAWMAPRHAHEPGGGAETAAELIARLEESDLADLIYRYGEERLSRRIARRIKADLKERGAYDGTAALAYAVAGCYPQGAPRARPSCDPDVPGPAHRR